MIWGTTGYSKCREDILEPLELYSFGGSEMNGKMTYIIHSYNDKNFKLEVYFDDIDNISKNKEVKKLLRNKKLERICNG